MTSSQGKSNESPSPSSTPGSRPFEGDKTEGMRPSQDGKTESQTRTRTQSREQQQGKAEIRIQAQEQEQAKVQTQQVIGEKEGKKKKTLAELDEELRLKMEGIVGDGGEAGVEYEDGVPVAMKRSVKSNMFRYI